MLVVRLLAAAAVVLYGLLLFPKKPAVPVAPPLSAPLPYVLPPPLEAAAELACARVHLARVDAALLAWDA